MVIWITHNHVKLCVLVTVRACRPATFASAFCVLISYCLLASVNRVSPWQKRGSCWRTDWLNVIIVQDNTLGGQLVNIGSFNLWAVKTHITPTEIIHQNEQNMRLFRQWNDWHKKIRQVNESDHAYKDSHRSKVEEFEKDSVTYCWQLINMQR